MNTAQQPNDAPAPREAATIRFNCPTCGPTWFTREALTATTVFPGEYVLTRPCGTCGAPMRRQTQPTPPVCP
jgi:endogenous inhibitor of DNA gyrase (YacG/DUF329 family)